MQDDFSVFAPPTDGATAQDERQIKTSPVALIPSRGVSDRLRGSLVSWAPGEWARCVLLFGSMNTRSDPGWPWSFQGSGRKENQCVVVNERLSGICILLCQMLTFSGGFFLAVLSARLLRSGMHGPGMIALVFQRVCSRCVEPLAQKLPPHGTQNFRPHFSGWMDAHLQFQTDLVYRVHDAS